MARKIDVNKSANNAGAISNSVLTGITNPEEMTEKMVFRFDDVVTLVAQNVDLEYATRGN